MSALPISDEAARKSISEDLNKSIFVEASAGSGKTTSLVNRMVALVEQGIPVNEICTITFTVAAADEFFERFQNLLSRRSIDNPNDDSIKDLGQTKEETRKLCLNALNDIDLCFTGTMDSFCNMVAHELPNELGIPSDAEVISDEVKMDMIKKEYFRVLTDDKHPLYELAGLFNKTFKKPFDAFCAGVKEVFDYRGYSIAFNTDLLDPASDHVIDNEIKEFRDLLDAIQKDGIGHVAKTHAKTLDPIVDKRNRLSSNWKETAQYYIDAVKMPFSAIFDDQVGGTDLETNYLCPNGNKGYKFDPALIDDINKIGETVNEYCFQLYFSFLSKICDEVAKNMKKESKFTFFDFLYYLTEKFKENSATKNRELISHVYDRHKYILIDESQDTNPMQTELFFYLTGKKSTSNWEYVEPEDGSLFIVGDPKQSIYSFRGADVNAYNHVKDVFGRYGDVINLTKNFRSNIEVKKYFNNVMNSVLNVGTNPLTHPNIPLTATTQKEIDREIAEQDSQITLNGVYKYDTTQSKKEDAIKLAEIIKKIVNNDDYKIIAKSSNVVRKIDYKDILIITRGKKVPEIISKFAEEKIPLRVEAKIYFSNSPSVDILKKLLYLVFEPYKKQHFLDVVMSDLYKLNTSDIIAMKNDGFDLDISNLLDKDGNPVVFKDQNHANVVNELNKLYLETKELTVSSTLFFLLTNKDYKFFDKVSSDFLDYAYFMVESVKAAEKSGTIKSFDDAKKFLDKSINDDSDVEKIMKFSDEVNQVKISNLHKVKGLQAPVVILAEPATQIHAASKYVDRVNKTLYFSSIGVKNTHGRTLPIFKSKKYDNQMILANNEQEAEERRIEYVAATRAESVLIIGKPDKLDSDNRNPWSDLLLDNLPDIPDYPDANNQPPVPEAYQDVMANYQSVVNDDSNQASYANKSPSGLRIRSGITNVDEVVEKTDDYDKALLGTLVHRILECIVTSRNQFDIRMLVIEIFKEYDVDRQENQDLFTKLCEIGKVFTETGFKQTTNIVPQNLFEALMNAEEVLCELPFSYKSGTNIISGIIDLVYKDESGWHIIDYKTNAEGDIAILEQEYARQLDLYRKAFKQATGFDCDAHIYHIDL